MQAGGAHFQGLVGGTPQRGFVILHSRGLGEGTMRTSGESLRPTGGLPEGFLGTIRLDWARLHVGVLEIFH